MGEPVRAHVTWEVYETLPDDGIRYEVLEGELMMTPAPGYVHQTTVGNVFRLVDRWLEASHTGGHVLVAPFDVVLANDSIVQPDLVYLSEKTLSLVVHGRLPAPPDIAVEIFHRKRAKRDTVAKFQVYARYKIPEYWLVNLDARAVTILQLQDATYEVFSKASGNTPAQSRVLAGLSVLAADVFKGI